MTDDQSTRAAADQSRGSSTGSSTESTADGAAAQAQPEQPRVVVITPEGMGVAEAPSPTAEGTQGDDKRATDEKGAHEDHERTNPAELVEEPAKVMRIGSMIKQLLEEVRSAPLDEKGRQRLAEIHHQSIVELKDGLAPELVDELERIAQPFRDESPSDAELRIAQAQLVGWLEGLFHGIQAALMAQQMATQQQLQQIRALPGAPHQQGGHPMAPQSGDSGPTGQYL